jgi:hypothetical protein
VLLINCWLKKVFAIILLSVHLFNLIGYTLFFRLLQQYDSKQTVIQIDNKKYADTDLVLVKVPMLLPYSANLAAYERYDGEIEWGGVHYNYVKRKMVNDTLYVLCLPNEHRTKLFDAEDTYGQQVNDMATSKQKESNSTVKKVIVGNEYDQPELIFSLTTYMPLTGKHSSGSTASLLHIYLDGSIRPPQSALS